MDHQDCVVIIMQYHEVGVFGRYVFKWLVIMCISGLHTYICRDTYIHTYKCTYMRVCIYIHTHAHYRDRESCCKSHSLQLASCNQEVLQYHIEEHQLQ